MGGNKGKSLRKKKSSTPSTTKKAAKSKSPKISPPIKQPEKERDRIGFNEQGDYVYLDGKKEGELLYPKAKGKKETALVKVSEPQQALKLRKKEDETFIVKLLDDFGKEDSRSLAQTFANTSLETAKSSTNTLRGLVRRHGEDETLTLLGFLLWDINDYFNVGKGMTSSQIAQVSVMILSKYDLLKVEELICIFQYAKENAKLYDRFDGAIVFEWVQVWLEDEAIRRENEHIAQKSQSGKDMDEHEINKRFKVVSDKMIQKYRDRDIDNRRPQEWSPLE